MDQDMTKDNEDMELLEDDLSLAEQAGQEEIDLLDEDNAVKKMREKLRVCEDEKKAYLDGWQRAQADAVNYKKDEGKRLEDLGRFITQSMLSDLLPVLDSFDLALQSFSAKGGQQNQIEQGVLMIRSQLTDAFKKRGVAQIEVMPGDAFNPEKHESVGEVESDKLAGTVAEEVQKGYTLAGRVIRPVRVRLAK
ncbi:MAG: nucleotide exchange factor GrpE [Candidatus Sungbacteria bacterium]|nr:nucleotide exchange factor GrpE [Candidatus Sungbacteria bacterium]